MKYLIMFLVVFAAVLGGALLVFPKTPSRHIILDYPTLPDSAALYKDGVEQWKIRESNGGYLSAIPTTKSFTQYGPRLVAWNIDKESRFYVAWEDPKPGESYVVVYWPGPDTVEVK